MESIVACRSQISDRFPVASFAIRVPPSRYYEVACTTDPRLFHARFRRERTRANFFSSRERGLLQAPRGDTAFMLPPDQLQRFAGSRRVFYALASYGSPRGDDAHFSVGPETLDRLPSIALAPDFTGRGLDRARIGHPRPSSSEYGGEQVELVWGGDIALEAEARRAQAEGADAPYDDGHDPSLWEQGQDLASAPDPSADADRLSADPPVALAIAAESGADCDDTAPERIGRAASYGYADSAGQERDDEEEDEQAASGLTAAVENDGDDQEDTAYGGYEDAAALHRDVYGDAENEEIDASGLEDERLADTIDDGATYGDGAVYGSVAALEEVSPAEDPELAGAMGELTGRDPDYAYDEQLGEGEDLNSAIALEVRPLDIAEKVRLLRVVARAESGRDGYSAINPDNEYNNPHHPAYHRHHIGLSFGFIQFTQRSGLLGKVLKAARARSVPTVPAADRFETLFGSDWQPLLDVTNAATAEARVAPVGGHALWEPTWTDRFRRAGQVEYVRAAQNEVAIRECVDPILTIAGWVGFTTPRALSMLVDRVIHMGLGGGLTWVLASCGPLNAEPDWRRALAAVGAPDLAAFQRRTSPPLTADGKFGPRVHAALIAALRALGAGSPIAIPGRDAMLRTLVEAAAGRSFARRLQALHENRADFDDAVTYDLGER